VGEPTYSVTGTGDLALYGALITLGLHNPSLPTRAVYTERDGVVLEFPTGYLDEYEPGGRWGLIFYPRPKDANGLIFLLRGIDDVHVYRFPD